MRFCAALFCIMSCCAVFSASSSKMHIERDTKTFSVCLPSNPTTGYRWVVDIPEDKEAAVHKVSERYTPSSPKRMGSAGETCFVFEKCLHSKSSFKTTLIFKYQRPWESQAVEVRKIVVSE